MDRHACRPDLRFALAAARPRGSLCVHGLQGEVCERFRGGVDQGDGPRSLRHGLSSAEKGAVNTVSVVWIGKTEVARFLARAGWIAPPPIGTLLTLMVVSYEEVCQKRDCV